MKRTNAVRFVSLALAVAVVAAPAFARGKKSSSTAPGKYSEWGPDIDKIEIVKTIKFSDYSKIVVEPFDTSGVELPGKDDNSYEAAKKVLASATEGFVQGLRGSVDQKVTLADGKARGGAGTLIIRGKVTTMDPGSKAARYWAGFGAGAARSGIEADVVDAATGQVVIHFSQERRSGVGVMGGDYQELMQRNLNAIGEDAANMLKAF